MTVLTATAVALAMSAEAASVSFMNGSHDIENGSGADGFEISPAIGLLGLGHTVDKFETEEYGAALALNPITVMEQGAAPPLPAPAVEAYMTGGGTVIQAGGSTSVFFDALFGGTTLFGAVTDPGRTWSKTGAAATGAFLPFFGDDPGTLVGLDRTYPATTGLPEGATILWGAPDDALVFHIAVGAGHYFYIGWDFCCLGTEAQRNDHYAVLYSAIGFVTGGEEPPAPVPLPPGLPLLGAGLLALGLIRRRG